jgi:DNA-binding winged helix-turn-helix (wHTH) protein
LYEFGPFRLDVRERLLQRDGVTISLTPKAFDLLLALVERHGRLVEKEEIFKAVWPDSFVEESNLTYNISFIRKALGDGENGLKFIETVPKRGYRFVAEVRQARPVTDESEQVAQTTETAMRAEDSFSKKRHLHWRVVALYVLLFGCLALLGYGIYRYVAPKSSIPHFQNIKLTRLTSVGNVGPSACVSPDGKFIAYVQTEAEQHSLWTKAIATGSAVQIVAPSAASLADTMFSPDGNYVYYKSRSDGPFYLYQIPVLGGTLKKVLTGDISRISFSPDGSQFAFARRRPDLAKSELVMVNADGSGERVLATRELRENFRGVAWSPDGKVLAAYALSLAGNLQKNILLGFAVASGEVKPLFQQDINGSLVVEWFKDGNGLAMIHRERIGALND